MGVKGRHTSSTAAAPADSTTPGSRDHFGRLVIDGNVRAQLASGGAALKGVWIGTWAGVPQVRDALKAYSQTHGYKFDEVVNRSYDILVTPEVKDGAGNVTTYSTYDVYLPLSNAPATTPEQDAGLKPPTADGDAPASASSAPAAAASAAAPAPAASAAQ
ncbi:MAG: hypothetical protein WDW36_007906 [Sanguina aurantia]